ncbi:MAG: VOC family protein [Thermoleophilaceae bacterium]
MRATSPASRTAAGTSSAISFAPSRPRGEAGVRPYVYVDSVDETLDSALARGAEVVERPYPEGNLRVATFRDPAGNVVGVWQQAS